MSLPIYIHQGRLIVMPKRNRSTTPGLLISRYTCASGYSARRQLALPSSQVTPMCTCPGLRPRWCPKYSPITHSGLLPSHRLKRVGFLSQLTDYPNVHDYTYFGAQYTACTLASSGFPDTSGLPGLPADVTTDLLARL